jgi:chromosome partitioning protein
MAGKDKSVPRLPRRRARPAPSAEAKRSVKSAIIAIYSVKGGVGKTTLSANCAWCSAMLAGHKTLLWDLDASGGAGYLVGVDPGHKKRAEGLFSKDRDPASLIRETDYHGLDLLPADESLRALDLQLSALGKKRRLARLAEDLSKDYARIVLDCPPVLNELSAQVMRAADIVIVPLPPSPLSARAFDMVVAEIRANAGKRQPSILPVLSMIDLRRKLHREAVEVNSDWPVIPFASVTEQSAVRRKPVGAFAPRSPASQAFAALWRAIDAKLAGKA